MLEEKRRRYFMSLTGISTNLDRGSAGGDGVARYKVVQVLRHEIFLSIVEGFNTESSHKTVQWSDRK